MATAVEGVGKAICISIISRPVFFSCLPGTSKDGISELVELMRQDWLKNREAAAPLRAGAVPFVPFRKLHWDCNVDVAPGPPPAVPKTLREREAVATARRAAGRQIAEFLSANAVQGDEAVARANVAVSSAGPVEPWVVVRSTKGWAATEAAVARLAGEVAKKRWL